MKTKLFLMAMAISVVTFSGCNDDDDNFDISKAREVETAFIQKYPNAQGVKWEKKMEYIVAEFRRTEYNADADAWFDRGAAWHLTKTEITYNALPQAVKSGFEASKYSGWRVDDVDMVERPNTETVYIIEVEQNKNEYDLYFSEDGTLIKAIPDTNNNPGDYITGELSAAISGYITTNYPQARIVDIEIERGGMVEVDIIDGRTPRELLFSASGEWVYTKTEIRRTELPQTILTALAASEYANYSIDDVDLYNTPGGDYYILELESGSKEVHVKFLPDGSYTIVKQ